MLNTNGELEIIQGTPDWTDPSYPAHVDGKLPIAYVMLMAGDTEIENGRIYDARPFFTMPSPDLPDGAHVHVYQEDLSLECDGAKTEFLTANQYEAYSLNVFHNGHLLRMGATKDYTEGTFCDSFALQITAPSQGDSLVVEYLAELA